MSGNNKHDIDFFRGNKKDSENINPEENKDLNNVDSKSYHYEDFKFKKKMQEDPFKNKLNSQANSSYNRPEVDMDNTIFQRDEKEEELRLAQYRRMKREKELELARQNDALLQQEEKMKAKERIRVEKLNKNPRIASGERLPLKPARGNFNSDNNHKKSIPKMPKVKKNNKSRNIKVAIKIILIIILLLVIVLGAIFGITKLSPATNFVIIGTDQREGEKESEVRADAIMNVTVSSKDNKMLLASIPRDTFAKIPCEKEGVSDKITHAYAFGGVNWGDGGGIKCTVEAVNELIDTNSDKYVKINFEDTIDVINSLHGITLKASATFCEQDSKGKKDKEHRKCFKKGQTYEMDGEQALAYARHRKSDDDIQRGLRQQEVFKAMFSKAKKLNIFQLINFAGKMNHLLNNNLTFIEKAQIALIYATNGDIDNYKFDWEGYYYNGVSYVKLDVSSLNRYKESIKELN